MEVYTFETHTGAQTGVYTNSVVSGRWSHTENEIGEAQFELAGLGGDCCRDLATLRPYVDSVRVVQDAVEVFAGPVVNVANTGDGRGLIEAKDYAEWLNVRFARAAVDHTAVPVPVSQFLAEIVTSALSISDPIPGLVHIDDCLALTNRKVDLVATPYPLAWPLIQPLLGTLLSMSVTSDGIWFQCEGECFGSLGTLNSLNLLPSWALGRQGSNWATRAASRGPDPEGSGASPWASVGGISSYYPGVLVERVYEDAGATDSITAAESAAKHVRTDSPIGTANGTDSAEFDLTCSGFSLRDLVPGACLTLALSGCIAAQQDVRIRTVAGETRSGVDTYSVSVLEIR